MKSIFKHSLFLFMTFFSLEIFANNLPIVNIITWWGYLDYPEVVDEVEKICSVTLSFDEYYSNNEFLSRWGGRGSNYDVAIFSNTIYDVIKNKIALNNSTLFQVANHYHPIIKKQFFQSGYSSNIAYFLHALSGFLYNPNVVQLSANDSVEKIFQKANNNIIILMDDTAEVETLIMLFMDEKYGKANLTRKELQVNNKSFNNIFSNKRLYITNNYNRLYLKSDFAMAFIWSGQAIYNLTRSKRNFKFLVHPKLSYISSDLVANLNNKESSICVAQSLASKKILDVIQQKDNYITSFVDNGNVTNEISQDIYKKFIKELPNLAWLNPMPEKEYNNIKVSWETFVLENNEKTRLYED